MSEETREMEVEKLPPGTRVKHDYAKWDKHPEKGNMTKDPEWSTRTWARTKVGVTVEDREYGPFPNTHPWGVPGFATAVKFDGERVTWIRTSCLDVLGWTEKENTHQQELF